MQNILDICKEYGLEIPADNQQEFTKKVAANYIAKAEMDKKYSKLEAERDSWKDRAEKAESALESLGDDPEKLKGALEQAKQELKDAKANYEKDLQARDFEDALKESIAASKGKNAKAIRANLDIESLMKSRNQKADIEKAIADLKAAEDTSFLFVNEEQERINSRAVSFTADKNPKGAEGSGGTMTAKDIMNIKDASERQAAIAQHIDLFN